MTISSRGAAKRVIDTPLSTEQFNALLKCSKDPFFFSTFIKVIDPVIGAVPFDLYPYQRMVLAQFIKNRFNIVKKFRQAGLTELLCMFALWYAMFHSNKNINIISIKDIVAKKFLRKIKFMYRHLPDYLKVAIVNGRTKDLGTASELEFANGSIISSIPTTEEAGRSEALSLLIIDEAAIIRWADQIWAAAMPTLSTGGRAILNSTPYGMGNMFHKTWVNACSEGSSIRGARFVPINLKWQMHPLRYRFAGDMEWYDDMRAALGPRRTAQEIDGDFLTSGNSVFDLLDIRAIEEGLDQYEPLDVKNHAEFGEIFNKTRVSRDLLRVYNLPDPRKKYAIGADISTGRSRDYTALAVFDHEGEEVASLKQKIAINEAAYILQKLGYIYNNAVVAPESNDIGLGVATKMQEDEYPNLYYSVKMLRKKVKKRGKQLETRPEEQQIPGWYTTSKNRPVIIAELEEDIRLEDIIIKDPQFVDEAYTFVYDDRNRPVALGKNSDTSGESVLQEDTYTDDDIMGTAIGNHVRKVRQSGLIMLPI